MVEIIIKVSLVTHMMKLMEIHLQNNFALSSMQGNACRVALGKQSFENGMFMKGG